MTEKNGWAGAAAGCAWAALIGIAALRLATLGWLALTDTTEGRYASIAWHMARTGDWVTPWIHIKGSLVAFWGKPPLTFWLTAASFRLFGAEEWAARLPSYLIAVALVAGSALFARRVWSPKVGGVAAILLSSSVLFFILGGACILDVALAGAVGGAMISFGLSARADAGSRTWGYAFFFFLALGALAKGPIALVLVGLPLAAWLLLCRQWSALTRLPWVTGLALFAAAAVPWYVAAERKTPGFLQYFLINEHVLRYVVRKYGDLYGSGRQQPYGASWAMLVAGFLPWTAFLVSWAASAVRRDGLRRLRDADPWLLYALCWGLAPAVFFTFARQILFTYLLPGLPGLALALAFALDRWDHSERRPALLRMAALHAGVLVVLCSAALGAALVRQAALPWTAAAAAVLCVVAWLAWTGRRRQEVVRLVSSVGLGASLALGTAFLAFGPVVDEAYSSKVIVGRVLGDPALDGLALIFPHGDVDSATFYAEAVHGRRIERHRTTEDAYLEQELDRGTDGIYVFQRRHWDEVADGLKARLKTVAETPHWVACRPRVPN